MPNEHDYAKVVAKTWSDPAFRDRLFADPIATLNAEGWNIPPSVKIAVEPEGSEYQFVLGLPKKPEGMSDHELRKHAETIICFC